MIEMNTTETTEKRSLNFIEQISDSVLFYKTESFLLNTIDCFYIFELKLIYYEFE